MKLKYPARLRDLLNHLSPGTGASAEYCQGIVMGAVSLLMAQGLSYTKAVNFINEQLPDDYRRNGLPESWRFDFKPILKFDLITEETIRNEQGGLELNSAFTTDIVIEVEGEFLVRDDGTGLAVCTESQVEKALRKARLNKIGRRKIEIVGNSESGFQVNGLRPEIEPLYELRRVKPLIEIGNRY